MEPNFFKWWPVKGEEANWNTGGSIWTLGNNFYCESDWALKQVAQRGCRVFILAVDDRAWAGAVGWGDPQIIPTSIILWSCDNKKIYHFYHYVRFQVRTRNMWDCCRTKEGWEWGVGVCVWISNNKHKQGWGSDTFFALVFTS